jgi:hypothetical protein
MFLPKDSERVTIARIGAVQFRSLVARGTTKDWTKSACRGPPLVGLSETTN